MLNEYVIVLEEGLTARGESLQDTMMNVQAAYMVCKDADFVRHAKDEYARWEQGASRSLKEYMASALNKYQALRMKGVWEAARPGVSGSRTNAVTPRWPAARLVFA